MQLRPYQITAKSDVNSKWAEGHRVVILRMPTGGGKTPTFASVMSDEPGPSVAIAHRSELVSQSSMALAKYGLRHKVIGPKSLAKLCTILQLAEFGNNYVDTNAKSAVAGVNTLVNRNEPWFGQVKLWVVDECFPAGTLVSGKPIETLKVGDHVEAFNEITGSIEIRMVTRLFKNPEPKHMVRVICGSHHELQCTTGHPFYTKRGWVEAGNLTINDEVLEEERRLLKWVRVDSVEVQERNDHDGNGYVYNIEVEGLHTYIANGIVVHNCHHLLEDNVWGKAVRMFPNARGLGVTATPGRADGKGLGRHADGLADTMVHGPEMSELIATGYLSKYKIYCPPSDVDISNVHVTAGGEFNHQELSSAIHASRTIVGDAVRHYLERAAGKLGISFTVDVAAATELAAAYRQAGVPAEVVTGKTPPLLRAEIMRRFRRREILQLTNVGIVGEGVDVPAVECVSMLCHHNSFNLYAQEFGRMLRLLLPDDIASKWDTYTDEFRLRYLAQSDKPHGILFDHVGNVLRHGGPPDIPRVWTLDRRNKRSSGESDVIPYRICANPECVQPYERIHKCCPHCGFYPEPVSRSSPEFVDGDLLELDERTLAAMRGEIARIDADPVIPWGATPIVEGAVRKRHRERQQAQSDLRNALAWWAGLQDSQGLTESQSYRRFYHRFGVDVAGAQTLGSREASELVEKINRELTANGIDGTVNAEAYFANEQNS